MENKILVIGQTPPPFYGQAMMVDRLIKGSYSSIKLYHVRMSFSKSSKNIGKFEVKKLVHIVQVTFRALYLKFNHSIPALYYLPAGPNRNPILRDIILLLLIRPFFSKTIFHFRAAGLSSYIEDTKGLMRFLAFKAYGNPTLSIQLSNKNPPDGKYFQSEKVAVIKNGIEDEAFKDSSIDKEISGFEVSLLYVGLLIESKGVMVLLEAIKMVRDAGLRVKANFVGEYVRDDFKEKVENFCEIAGIQDVVQFVGSKIGKEKWGYYRSADVLCFPTFFESESFGNVVIEGMMFGLPVIATKWRGVQDLVADGETGILVDTKNPEQLYEAINTLYSNPQLRISMGKNGRTEFIKKYTLDKHLTQMEESLSSIFVV